jgi:hypothetical protein
MMRGGIAAGLGLALLTGACALDGRTTLGASYGALLAENDRDGDGLLSREEATAMVATAFPPGRRAGAGWDKVRARLVADTMAKDRDGDGRLSLGELLGALPNSGAGSPRPAADR